MIGHYQRDGGIKIGGPELDSPSAHEIARQERVKHEGEGFGGEDQRAA